MAGDFPSDWQLVQLEDCMDAIIDYRGKTPRKTSVGIPLITAKVVKGGRIETPNEFVDPSEYDDWMRRGLPMTGDVLVTTEAPLGEIAQIGNPRIALAQRLIALRGKKGKLDNTFLKFLMQSAFIQDQLKARASGTTVLGIKQSELRKITLPLPQLKTQQAIGCILGALDDKVELNRRMNRTLEAMARAIFKSWFVDFDPVIDNALINDKPIPERMKERATARAEAIAARSQQPGFLNRPLPAPIASLFADEFEDSTLGHIPKGTKVRSLPEIMEINPTRSLAKGAIAPYLDMANMPTQGPSPDSWVMREMGSGMKFVNGDTLVARITPCLENGKTAFVDFLTDDEVGWGSTEYIVLRPKGAIPPVFAYLLARTDDFRAFAIRQMTGSSGRQRVPANSLDKYGIAIPDPVSPVFEHFGRLVSPMFERITVTMAQSRAIAALRYALLPKLVSGALRIPDADRLIGRAL